MTGLAHSLTLLSAVWRVLPASSVYNRGLELFACTYHLSLADSASPDVHLSALLKAWHAAAVQRAAISRVIREHRQTWLKHSTHKALAMWHVLTQYKKQMARTLETATITRDNRMSRRALRWWHDWVGHVQWRETCVQQCHAGRSRRLLLGWQAAAVAEAGRRQRVLLAVAMHVRRLMAGAMAHWRVLHLREHMKRTWLKVRVTVCPRLFLAARILGPFPAVPRPALTQASY